MSQDAPAENAAYANSGSDLATDRSALRLAWLTLAYLSAFDVQGPDLEDRPRNVDGASINNRGHLYDDGRTLCWDSLL